MHLIRDGRDVALSLRKMWFAPAGDIAGLASYWRNAVLTARASQLEAGRCLEARYEDLVLSPRPVLKTICSLRKRGESRRGNP